MHVHEKPEPVRETRWHGNVLTPPPKSRILLQARRENACGQGAHGARHLGAIDVRGTEAQCFEGRDIVLSATDQNAGNSFDNPENVAPVEKKLAKLKAKFSYQIKPNSFTVLCLKP